ncbi:MAG: YdeI/OmpD-associated family protein [Flavitalea sp.]
MESKLIFFSTPSGFRKWLAKNHSNVTEQWVGFYKKDSGKPSITWPESVDQALCYGWIDGIRKSIDEVSYMIRFTPRKKGSNWSIVNIKRVAELRKLGVMKPAGLKIFKARDPGKVPMYSFEQQEMKLSASYEKKLMANKKAWLFFQSQAPYYRRTASWWVISAKQEQTQLKRLEILITSSERGERIPMLRPTEKKK